MVAAMAGRLAPLATLGHLTLSCLSLASAMSPSAGRSHPGSRGVFPGFAAFVQQYGRSYEPGSSEYEERRAIYEQRVTHAERHNGSPSRRWTQGVNELWDWTAQELSRLRGWKRVGTASSQAGASKGPVLEQENAGHPLPKEVFWTNLNTTQSIYRQGSCGSCWALASATVLEAHAEIHAADQVHRTFSPQELVSCVPNPKMCGGTGGCDGATIELAFEWSLKHGLAQESEVPYEAITGTCSNPAALLTATVPTSPFGRLRKQHPRQQAGMLQNAGSGRSFGMSSWLKLPENKYEPLMRALVERGPIGVSVAADGWFTYSTGIFDGCEKDAVIDHAVVLVGYGKDADLAEKYWLLQNSWGRDWGEAGRMRLLRHDNEESWCGTDTEPQQGSGCIGGPPEVTVCGSCGILYDTVVPIFDAPARQPISGGAPKLKDGTEGKLTADCGGSGGSVGGGSDAAPC